MDPLIATSVILIAAIIIFIWNKFPPAVVALAVALALFFSGTVTFEQAIIGLSDPSEETRN